MDISEKKQLQLQKVMKRLGINEEDLIEKFILSPGKGGQKLQKTYSCVHLKHLPTRIIVKCSQDRQREANRYFARKRLCEKIKEITEGEKSKKQQETEKIRRQKKRRSRKSKEKMLEEKKRRSTIKQSRKKPMEED